MKRRSKEPIQIPNPDAPDESEPMYPDDARGLRRKRLKPDPARVALKKCAEEAKHHRRRERAHLGSLRYAIRNGLYDMAFRELLYAFQQSTVADLKERGR